MKQPSSPNYFAVIQTIILQLDHDNQVLLMQANHRYFITGTDTSVGKTLVTAAMMCALQAMGYRCLPVKPIQTGVNDQADDFHWCLSFSQQAVMAQDEQEATPVRLGFAASPHLAAQREHQSIRVQQLLPMIQSLSSRWDVILIEGAGGLLTPINQKETMLDLIKASQAIPIIVSRNILGTLNHTALTLHELARHDLIPAAIVMTDTTPMTTDTDNIIRDDNVATIRRWSASYPVVAFPHQSAMDRSHLLTLGHFLLKAMSIAPVDSSKS